jgi:hypothetical protein
MRLGNVHPWTLEARVPEWVRSQQTVVDEGLLDLKRLGTVGAALLQMIGEEGSP